MTVATLDEEEVRQRVVELVTLRYKGRPQTARLREQIVVALVAEFDRMVAAGDLDPIDGLEIDIFPSDTGWLIDITDTAARAKRAAEGASGWRPFPPR